MFFLGMLSGISLMIGIRFFKNNRINLEVTKKQKGYRSFARVR